MRPLATTEPSARPTPREILLRAQPDELLGMVLKPRGSDTSWPPRGSYPRWLLDQWVHIALQLLQSMREPLGRAT